MVIKIVKLNLKQAMHQIDQKLFIVRSAINRKYIKYNKLTTKSEKKHIPFTEEERKNILALGEVLRDISNRLLKEGKIEIKNGKIIWDKALLLCINGTCEHSKSKEHSLEATLLLEKTRRRVNQH